MGGNHSQTIKRAASVTHFLLIVAAWSSPFWLEWQLIVVGVFLLYGMYFFSGGCPLTFIEAGRDKYQTFYYYHLVKMFPTLNKRYVFVVVRYVVPVFLIVTAVVLQHYYNIVPLVSFF